MSISKESWLEATGGLPANFLLRATTTLSSPGSFAHAMERLTFLDIETERIVWGATPRPLVACTSDASGKTRRVYRPEEFGALRRDLRRASAVVTFNGDAFDFKVIAKTIGTTIRQLGMKSFDLMVHVERRCKWRHSLNNLAYVNLGEPKSCLGVGDERDYRSMVTDCHQDVDQLRRLFLLYIEGKLKLPVFGSIFTKKAYRQMPFGGQCPHCYDIASINELPPEHPEKELDAALLAAVIGDHEACRDLVGVDRAYRCFNCGVVFVTI